MSLFAAQTDFTEPGELQLFIDPAQVHMLDSMMWQRGFLTAQQMTGAFQMLRSQDLIWSRVIHEYLLGRRTPMSAWLPSTAPAALRNP
jgi:polyhydroxyalkanoate synthase